MQNVLEQNPKVLNVKDLNVKTNYFAKTSVIIVGSFVLFTIIMIIIAYIKEENEKLTAESDRFMNHSVENIENSSSSKTETKSISNPPDVIAHCRQQTEPKKISFGEQVISCFSLRQNFASLTSLKTSPNAVPVIDGLK